MRRSLKAACLYWCLQATPLLGQLHFATLGNWGSGTKSQWQVAETLKASAKPLQLSFLVSPGSNIVKDGELDEIWDQCVIMPYNDSRLHIPMYAVLGEHDWTHNVTQYSAHSDLESLAKIDPAHKGFLWTFPNFWYHVSQHFKDAPEISFASSAMESSVITVFIDTYVLSSAFPFKNITRLHWDSLELTLSHASRVFDWIIVVGNKALLSSGPSGGDHYLYQILSQLFKKYQVDAYISGNDNDMEILEAHNVTYINCGTGSSANSVPRAKHKASKGYISKLGFCHHKLTATHFITELIDAANGTVALKHTMRKTSQRQPLPWNRYRLFRQLPEVMRIPLPDLIAEPKTVQTDDWFVRTVGTLGLMVFGYLMFMGAITVGFRARKHRQKCYAVELQPRLASP